MSFWKLIGPSCHPTAFDSSFTVAQGACCLTGLWRAASTARLTLAQPSASLFMARWESSCLTRKPACRDLYSPSSLQWDKAVRSFPAADCTSRSLPPTVMESPSWRSTLSDAVRVSAHRPLLPPLTRHCSQRSQAGELPAEGPQGLSQGRAPASPRILHFSPCSRMLLQPMFILERCELTRTFNVRSRTAP